MTIQIHHYLGDDRTCPAAITMYIRNLTSSYTDKSNEPSMVSASVIMFVLAGLFFNLNLFSGISDISAILDPKVRLFLTSALSLFLPVMSYLFSEAKNGHAAATISSATATLSLPTADLPLRAGLILVWMLLVELLRKKVDEIHMRGYSGTIQRAGRVVWLGNLVFFNIRSAGRKAVFSILWILCATKVLQRIAFTEVGKRSYAHGRNARLISSYMAQMLEQEPEREGEGDKLLTTCKYIVMGEEKLAYIEPTADGYRLDKTRPDDSIDTLLRENDGIVTVGKVWGMIDDDDKFFSSSEQTAQRLKRICLSFALFKLLRRRFDHVPAVTRSKEEARHSRDIILRGLCKTCSAEATFQVMSDEINFLCEYYHSVVPVVLASPFFLLANYFLVNIVVAVLCLMSVILCGNGDVRYAFKSIGSDNYTLRSGVTKLAICLLVKALKDPPAFFSIVDLSITILLFVIFFYEEIWEFLVFLLSNWFMVSLLYNYTSKPKWLTRATFRRVLFWGGFSIIMWIRSKMRQPGLNFRQFSVLSLRWPRKLPMFATFTSLAVKTKPVPNGVKKHIIDYLVQLVEEQDLAAADHTPLTNGKSALRRNNLSDELSWACESDSVAEVILTWHIATTVLEMERRPQSNTDEEGASKVAIRLSRYCAYLVAFHQELLPENPEKMELVFENMKDELKGMIGCRDYFFSSRVARVKKLLNERVTPRRGSQAQAQSSQERKVVRDGVNLGRSLIALGETQRWKVLADVWTEIVVFLAPSNDEERMKGHEDVLVQGGEFITVLWALTTHIGVSRPPVDRTARATTFDIQEFGP